MNLTRRQPIESTHAIRERRHALLDGTYGICVDCGADIPLERLRAQSGAPRCLACQRQREKTYRT